MRHILSLRDLNAEELNHLITRSVEIASGATAGQRPLDGKAVGVFFRRSSTRTRTAFALGAAKLGADVIVYGPQDLQLVTGETLADTGRVLSGYMDALVVRTNDPQSEMEELADQDAMAVINAMSAEEHPTQALADLGTIQEVFGRVEDIHLLYMGEGNNSAAALAFAFARLPGSRLTLRTPEGYGLPKETLERAQALAREKGATIEEGHDPDDLPQEVDVVYTTRWQTMGVSRADSNWLDKFKPFIVDSRLMSRVSRPGETIFMHDLPAVRGQDVTDEVLDGPQSRAWRQAQYKMFSAMAAVEWCILT